MKWIILFVAVAFSGCATLSEDDSLKLAGSSWQLLTFQSMDDAQGTLRVTDPARYRVTFNADGTAAFQLDCNRGRGTWQAAVGISDSGSLRFGPVAMTRMLCPQPSMAEKLARDLEYVRGYRFINGRLYLSLMADGGIYQWQRFEP